MITLWNDLPLHTQVLTKGFLFTLLCSALALFIMRKKGFQGTQLRTFWQTTLLGLITISILALLPAFLKITLAPEPPTLAQASQNTPVLTPSNPDSQIPKPLPSELTDPAQTRASTFSATTLITIIWLSGSIFLLVRWLLGNLFLRAQLRNSVQASPELTESFQQARKRLDLSNSVTLRVSSTCHTPFVTGFFRRIVIVPQDAQQWDAPTSESVFLHELAHLKGNDTRFLNLGLLLRALHWPNPLVWFGLSSWKNSAELAADETVINTGMAPTNYAEVLCRFSSFPKNNRLSLGLTMADHSSSMEQRIGRLLLLKPKPKQYNTMNKTTNILLAISAFSLGGLALSQEVKEAPAAEIQKEEQNRTAKLLNETILPNVVFSNATLKEITAFLSLRIAELNPKQSINFIIDPETSEEAPVIDSMTLKNVSAAVILQYVCDQTGTSFEAKENAVLITKAKKGAKKALPETKEEKAANKKIKAQLEAAKIDTLALSNATLSETIEFLRFKAQEQGLSLNIVVDKNLVERTIKDLKLEKVTFSFALKTVSQLTKTKYEIKHSKLFFTDDK